MKGEDLLRAMTEIEDRYILESDPVTDAAGAAKRRKTPRAAWVSALALAAVLLLAFAGGRSFLRHGRFEAQEASIEGDAGGMAAEEAAAEEEEEAAYVMEAQEADKEEAAYGADEKEAGVEEALVEDGVDGETVTEGVADMAGREASAKGVMASAADVAEDADRENAAMETREEIVTVRIDGEEKHYREVTDIGEALFAAGISLPDDALLSVLAGEAVEGNAGWYYVEGLADTRLLLREEAGVFALYTAADG